MMPKIRAISRDIYLGTYICAMAELRHDYGRVRKDITFENHSKIGLVEAQRPLVCRVGFCGSTDDFGLLMLYDVNSEIHYYTSCFTPWRPA